MQLARSLPATLTLPRRLAAIALGILVLIPNLYAVGITIWAIAQGGTEADWSIFIEAGRRITSSENPYTAGNGYAFRYSPIMAYAFALLAPIGIVLWRLAHLAILAVLPWRLALLTAVLWPFWFDIYTGSLMTFVIVAVILALRGNPWGTGIFLALTLLIPRPLMLPVAAWIMWKRPEWRLPFATMFAVHVVAVLATGLGDEWLSVLLHSTDEMTAAFNFGPSRFIGAWWLVVGVPLAAWLTWKGRLGYASLAVSPYWLPYYLLMLLLELKPRPSRSPNPTPESSPA